VRAMDFLGVRSHVTEPVMGYVHNPVVMSREVVIALLRHISKHRRQDWAEAILGSGSSEYQLYGVFATHFTPSGITRTPPLAAVNFWSPRHGDPRQHLYERVKAVQPKVVGIQSTLGFSADAYRPILEQIWNEAPH
jgi:hypothetical protein